MEKITCPYCGYKIPVLFDDKSNSNNIYIKCKGKQCKKSFEIQIKDGKQIQEVK